MAPAISIVIPTYNRIARLRATLDALVRQTIDKALFEIIVVDDGSEENIAGIVTELATTSHADLRYVRQKRAQAGSARNRGILEARSSLVLLMDNDILVSPHHVGRHLDLHLKYPAPEIGVLGRIVPGGSGVDLLRRRESDIKPNGFMTGGEPIIAESYLVTADVSLKKDFIVQSGMFKPYLPVVEDMDLALRLRDRGLCLLYCREAEAVHTEPLDTIDKVISEGKKYGRAFAEWKGRIPLYQDEIWKLGGRFNGGLKHFRSHPAGYAKDAVRRWTINRATIGILVRIARRKRISDPPPFLLARLCKEIWAFYYRNEFAANHRSPSTHKRSPN